jgi:hypothetical protein
MRKKAGKQLKVKQKWKIGICKGCRYFIWGITFDGDMYPICEKDVDILSTYPLQKYPICEKDLADLKGFITSKYTKEEGSQILG